MQPTHEFVVETLENNPDPTTDSQSSESSSDSWSDSGWQEQHLRTQQMFDAFKEEHERWLSEHRAKRNRIIIVFEAVMGQRRQRLANGGASLDYAASRSEQAAAPPSSAQSDPLPEAEVL